jgi:uncharacterized protein (UPF0548 family)
VIVVVSRRPHAALAEQLQRSANDEVTYAEVECTRSAALPAGYHQDRATLQIGIGEVSWQLAQQAITLWKAHGHAGLTVTPTGAPLEEGSTVLVSRGMGPLLFMAPCRIVYHTSEPRRFGFGYGTLPGHPEQGEEAFHVLRRDDGIVVAEIMAFSRPAELSTKLAAPLVRGVQKVAIRRYLQGIAHHVRQGESRTGQADNCS